MNKFFASLAVFVCVALPVAAQNKLFVVTRSGIQNTATGYHAPYHYVEVFPLFNHVIGPDCYYLDFAQSNYREVACGGGYTLVNKKNFTIAVELYYDQAFGAGSGGAKTLQPWQDLIYGIPGTKLGGEVVYFPYVPLNKAARLQHVIERATMFYDFGKFKVGGGYGGYKYGDDAWQNKPFAAVSFDVKHLGNVNVWAQKLPDNANGPSGQLQFRLTRIFGYRNKH